MEKSSELLFLKGNYRKIADSSSQFDIFRIAALVFLGRTSDAEILFEKWQSRISEDEKAIGSFFLTVGWTRDSEFTKARQYLGQLYQLRRAVNRRSSMVFVFQGFGFYRYFTSRYRKSHFWAGCAWRVSLEEDFSLGQILSGDLLAHSMLQTGEIEKGFLQIDRAKVLAEKFGRTAIVASLEVSRLTYEAQYGLNPVKTLARLSRVYLKTKTSRDTYTKANLGLELCQQLALRGQIRKARLVLQDLRKEVFKYGHRRQRSIWYIRSAYCEWLAGDFVKAGQHLAAAKAILDSQHDLAVLHQILVFEERLTNIRQPSTEVVGRKVGSLIATRQLRRRNREPLTFSPQDPFGNLLDSIVQHSRSRFEVFQEVVDLGYFGLLSEVALSDVGRDLGENVSVVPSRAIIIDLLPGSMLTIDHGNCVFTRNGLTSLMRRCLVLLALEPRTKEELIEEMWGYVYEPFRHDPLIYAVLARLRKSLGGMGGWIQFKDDRYHLDPSVRLKSYRHVDSVQKIPLREEMPVAKLNLNFRQLRILNELKAKPHLSIRECVEFLKTTKITANRDLKSLIEQKLITVSGRGKSTRYHA